MSRSQRRKMFKQPKPTSVQVMKDRVILHYDGSMNDRRYTAKSIVRREKYLKRIENAKYVVSILGV